MWEAFKQFENEKRKGEISAKNIKGHLFPTVNR